MKILNYYMTPYLLSIKLLTVKYRKVKPRIKFYSYNLFLLSRFLMYVILTVQQLFCVPGFNISNLGGMYYSHLCILKERAISNIVSCFYKFFNINFNIFIEEDIFYVSSIDIKFHKNMYKFFNSIRLSRPLMHSSVRQLYTRNNYCRI